MALQRSWPHAVYITKMILTGQAMVKIKMEEMTKLHQVRVASRDSGGAAAGQRRGSGEATSE